MLHQHCDLAIGILFNRFAAELGSYVCLSTALQLRGVSLSLFAEALFGRLAIFDSGRSEVLGRVNHFGLDALVQ